MAAPRKYPEELRERATRLAVERLMRSVGLRGVPRDKSPRTTRRTRDRPSLRPGQPAVHRRCPQPAVGRRHTLIKTHSGWVYAAFVIDVFSRMVVGWQVATSLYTELALQALEMGIWRRRHTGTDLAGLVHHSDRGVQGGPSATRSAWTRPVPWPRSVPRAIHTTTPSPRHSTVCPFSWRSTGPL